MRKHRFFLAALSSLLVLGLAAPQAFARDDRGYRDRDRQGHSQRHDGKREFRAYGQRDRRSDYGRRYDSRDHNRYNHGQAYRDRDHGRYGYDRRYSNAYRSDHRYRAPVVVHRPVVVQRPVVVHRSAVAPYGWARGKRYNAHYRGPVYVVHDYHHYHLRPPPYGHRWIRDDRGNMLLVAIATGVILDLFLNS